MTTNETIKTTLNLRKEEVEMVKKLAKLRGTTLTEVIRAAIRTDNLLSEEESKGAKILIEEADGSTKRLVFK